MTGRLWEHVPLHGWRTQYLLQMKPPRRPSRTKLRRCLDTNSRPQDAPTYCGVALELVTTAHAAGPWGTGVSGVSRADAAGMRAAYKSHEEGRHIKDPTAVRRS
jgi:hypothetical protein